MHIQQGAGEEQLYSVLLLSIYQLDIHVSAEQCLRLHCLLLADSCTWHFDQSACMQTMHDMAAGKAW